MGEHGEVPCGQLRPCEADEQDVLEHATAERDPVEPGADAEVVGDLGDEAGNRDVEPGRDGARRTTVPEVVDHRSENRCHIDVVASDRDPVVARRPEMGVGDRLQLDRRLRLVRDDVADPEQRTDCVEQPARTRRRDAMDSALELTLEHSKFVPRRGTNRGQIGVPLDARCPQVCERDAIRPADRRIAARQRHVSEVRDALECVVAGDEDLATPDRAVGAVAGAVEREADHPLTVGHTVLGHHRRDVGVVVLDERHLATRVGLSPPPGLIARVRVGDEQVGFDPVHLGELVRGLLERGERLDAAHVADVLAHPRVGTGCEAERVLQLTADGDDRRRCRMGVAREAARTRGSAGSEAPRLRRHEEPNRRTEQRSGDRGAATRRRCVRVAVGRRHRRSRSVRR